jgi:hypothetical protein
MATQSNGKVIVIGSLITRLNLDGTIDTSFGNEGYITKIVFGKDGDILPLAVGGGNTTYYCDQFWRNITANELKCVLVGGYAYDGGYAGFAYALTNYAPSAASANVGARLCFN